MDENRLFDVERIVVRKDRIRFDVRLKADIPRYTTPEIAVRLAGLAPSLALHSCVNEGSSTFGEVMDATSLPHVLEHLTIDIQVHAQKPSDLPAKDLFVGTTEWLDESLGRARIEISYTDDLVALHAFVQARRILEQAVLPWLS